MYPKARLDALSDGIFAVAMTLLILDIRLPDDFHPGDSAEFLSGVASLWPKFLPYVLSFGVLGLRWLISVEVRSRDAFVNRQYVRWWLLYLLLITCVPFTTIVVGRFGHFAPAIWLYAGHTMLLGLISYRVVAITPGLEQIEHLHRRRGSTFFLVASALIAIVLSLINPRLALWVLALNFSEPLLKKLSGKGRESRAP